MERIIHEVPIMDLHHILTQVLSKNIIHESFIDFFNSSNENSYLGSSLNITLYYFQMPVFCNGNNKFDWEFSEFSSNVIGYSLS